MGLASVKTEQGPGAATSGWAENSGTVVKDAAFKRSAGNVHTSQSREEILLCLPSCKFLSVLRSLVLNETE